MIAKNHHAGPAQQANQKPPDELQRDLNPNHMAGQNIGGGPSTLDPSVRFASEIKDLTRQLQDFTSDELREILVLPQGARLLQDAVYVDLAAPERRPLPGHRAEGREVETFPGARVRRTAHGLESADAAQRLTWTAVTRPIDAG
ncbi:hypothetical protein [Sorangium sp. So ce233]|uniref:hypothetical protein n=1 Tax=Sorangium sp. So ce233 TaxID=3133290 RepID=UPI003F5FE8BB